MRRIRVGVIDSGIGGLTVLKKLGMISNLDFIYLADTKKLPYGDKPEQKIVSYIHLMMQWLSKMQVDIVVIGCNTIDAIYSQNRDIFSQYHFKYRIVNIIKPTVNAIISLYPSLKNIGIISTALTAKSNAYSKAFAEHDDQNLTLISQPCPELVPWIESGMNPPELGHKLLLKYLAPLIEKGIELLVLGCTHYPIIRNIISDILKNIIIIDPADFVLENMKGILQVQYSEYSPINLQNRVKIFATDKKKLSMPVIEMIMKFPPKIDEITL